ncbi:MAG: rod-binding protein [Bdellovibrionota bacterium]
MKINAALPPAPRQVDPNDLPKDHPLWQAAQGMEANFMKEMVRNMRKTVQESPEMEQSRGYQIFRGMLDDQYAETAVKSQGIGIAELIVRQVLQDQENANAARSVTVRQVNKSDVLKK